MTTALKDKEETRVRWWLGVVNEHGYVSELTDGPHDERAGVVKALHIIQSLGLTRGRKFACVQCIETEVLPTAEGVNAEAIAILRSIGLCPP